MPNSYQIILDNIKCKYNLTNEGISKKTKVSKATLDKITSGKTKHLQEKTLAKLKKAFKGEFDSISETISLSKVFVDEDTKKMIDEINKKPELKKIYTITANLKSSDLKAVTHILESMTHKI